MTAQEPLVSVIIPVYNGALYLAEAIGSVLAQTYRVFELIVLDDGSTDESAAIVRSFGSAVRYHYQPNAGNPAARNLGVTLANGELLAFLDADDLWTDDKLALQVAALAADQSVDMVFGHMRFFRSPELDLAATIGKKCPAGLQPAYIPSAILVRRDSFRRVGNFSTQQRFGEMIDWYARALDAGLKSLLLAQLVLHRRVHAANKSARGEDAAGDYLRIVKASLDRRRIASQIESEER